MINRAFKSLIDLYNAFPTEQSCIDHLEELRWNGKVVSPFDPESKVYKCKGNKYRCRNTGKYFNVRTGTLFDNTKLSLKKWFLAIYLVTSHKKGISSIQLGKDIGVTQKTAWFMLHRIRNCFGVENNGPLENEVEVDETFIGGRNKNRHEHKKIKGTQGGNSKDKATVLGMVQRTGKLVAKKVPDTKAQTLVPQVFRFIKHSSNVYTDEHQGYRDLSRIYDHGHVKHMNKEYVNGRVHTNTIEGFWSLLKRGIFGIYHFTSKKHLQKYVDEFVFRYNTRSFTESARFDFMLMNTGYRLTYKALINGQG